MKLFKKAKKGFTLVELVVVIAVIAILAGVSVGAYFGITDSANKSKLEQEAKTAWTTVRLASLAGESHSTLDSSGLTINSESGFKNKVNFISGTNYYIDTSLPDTLTGKALIFDTASVSGAFDTSTTYKSFTYYDSTVTNQTGCKVDILSGKSSFVGGGFNVGGEDEKAPLAVTLSTTELVINEKENDRITVQVTGGNGNAQVTWTSSDTTQTYVSIAQQADKSVKITANSATNDDQVVTLTLTVSESGFDTVTKEVTVRVNNVANPVTHIVLDKTYLEFEASDIASLTSKEINATVLPVDADSKDITWSVSPEGALTISEPTSTGCIVKPNIVGSAEILATIGSVTTKCNVVVNPAPVVEDIVLEETYYEVSENADNKVFNIRPTLYPIGVRADISYSSNKTDVATVTETGVITANNPGTAVISVTAGGKQATVTVVVTPYYVDVEGISLDTTHLEFDANISVHELEATIYPSDANRNKEITWTSSDDTIATVSSDGKVVAGNPGRAIITATTANNKKATCSVTVHKVVTGLKLNYSTQTLTANGTDSVTLVATHLPYDSTNKEPIVWSVSPGSEDYIEVNQEGKVTAKAVATTTTEAKVIASSNGHSVECLIKTKLPTLTGISITTSEGFDGKLQAGTTANFSYSIEPFNANVEGATVEWSSSQIKVATVSNGLVTALFKGDTDIKATLTVGSKVVNATYGLTVTERPINDQFTVSRFLEEGFEAVDNQEKYSLTGYVAKWDTLKYDYDKYADFWLVDSLDRNPETHGIYVYGAQVFDRTGTGTSPIKISNYEYTYDNSTNKNSFFNAFDVGSEVTMEVIYNHHEGKAQLQGFAEVDTRSDNKLEVLGYFNGSNSGETFTRVSGSETEFTLIKEVEAGDPLTLEVKYGNKLNTNYHSVGAVEIPNTTAGVATKAGTFTFTFNYLTKTVTCNFKVDGDYYLVKDVDDLQVGDSVIVVAKDYNYALGKNADDKGGRREQISITRSGEKVIINNDVDVLTLKEGTVSGTFALYDNSGYLYAAGSNKLLTQKTNNDSSSFKITISVDGSATIASQANTDSNLLQYNKDNGWFSCYKSSSNQLPVNIYKLSEKEFDDPEIELSSFSTNPTGTIDLVKDGTKQIEIINPIGTDGLPFDLGNASKTYESSNSEYVSVSNTGLITAHKVTTSAVKISITILGIKQEILVTVSEQEKVWTKATNVSDIEVGDKIIIAADKSNFALSTTQNSNNRGQAAITKSANTLTSYNNAQVLTLEAGTISGTFAFNTGSGYLYAPSSSSNHLKTQTTKDANGSWKISITAGVATIKAQGSSTRNWLRYNSSNNPPLFSCYESGQADVCIYVLK